jgi:hypothetical protein
MLITRGSQLLTEWGRGAASSWPSGRYRRTSPRGRRSGKLANQKIQADLVERQLSRADGGSLSIRNPKFARTFGQHPWPRCLLLCIFAMALPLTPRTERFDNKSRRLRDSSSDAWPSAFNNWGEDHIVPGPVTCFFLYNRLYSLRCTS